MDRSLQQSGVSVPGVTWFCTGLAMLAFAGNSVLCRLALKQTSMDAASFSLLRVLSGALGLCLLCAVQRKPLAGKGSWPGALALAVYVAAFSFAYVELNTGTGALLLFGAVQTSMLGYGLWSGERLGPAGICGLLVAIAGLLVLMLPGAGAPSAVPAMIMLMSGVAWGVYSLLGRGAGDALAVNASNFTRAIPLLALAGLPFLDELRWNWQGACYAVLSGAVASGAGYAVWYGAVRRLAAYQAASVQLTVPVLAAFAGIVLLDEALTERLILSSVAVLGGVALVLSRKPGKR